MQLSLSHSYALNWVLNDLGSSPLVHRNGILYEMKSPLGLLWAPFLGPFYIPLWVPLNGHYQAYIGTSVNVS